MAKRYKNHLQLLMAMENVKRAKAGLPDVTQTEIADATGISRQAINRWLTNPKPLLAEKVSGDTIKAFCDFFGVTKDELLTEIGDSSGVAAVAAITGNKGRQTLPVYAATHR